ncbi:hypothetical protein MUK42_32108 [Musa troglodytarum]|uniref:Uncharacterized protein n=1 Tax=Musa troglodytarum TaxID=320322 RepID=A0A9E7IAI4_9LILI|nr:hypothetical protein MUK42_32108 [Musa troglodytarum]
MAHLIGVAFEEFSFLYCDLFSAPPSAALAEFLSSSFQTARGPPPLGAPATDFLLPRAVVASFQLLHKSRPSACNLRSPLFVVDLITFGLAIIAEQCHSKATVITDSKKSYIYCINNSNIATSYGIGAFLFLLTLKKFHIAL